MPVRRNDDRGVRHRARLLNASIERTTSVPSVTVDLEGVPTGNMIYERGELRQKLPWRPASCNGVSAVVVRTAR
jgi:hypothetical protein